MKGAMAVCAAALLAGCQSLAPDARFGPVEQAVQERTGVQTRWARSEEDATTVRARVAELLAKPLGPAEAVQVALINNPGLQAGYAEVGIAEADLVQASFPGPSAVPSGSADTTRDWPICHIRRGQMMYTYTRFWVSSSTTSTTASTWSGESCSFCCHSCECGTWWSVTATNYPAIDLRESLTAAEIARLARAAFMKAMGFRDPLYRAANKAVLRAVEILHPLPRGRIQNFPTLNEKRMAWGLR